MEFADHVEAAGSYYGVTGEPIAGIYRVSVKALKLKSAVKISHPKFNFAADRGLI
jgi:hypothetical protein